MAHLDGSRIDWATQTITATLKENPVYDNADKCCDSPCEQSCPEPVEQSAKRLRKQARRLEQIASAERKAKKRAAREERQRKADRDSAIQALYEIASQSHLHEHHTSGHRIAAAQALLQATSLY